MRLEEAYVADAEKRARRVGPRNCWTGGEAGLAADIIRLINERKTILATIDELERHNADLRSAVEKRLSAVVEVPPELSAMLPGVTFVEATPQPPAEFKVTRVGASMSPEQLRAAWSAIEEKARSSRAPKEPAQSLEVLTASAGVRLIGISGRAGAGKNAVAGMIDGAAVVQLADPLYAALAAMLGVSESILRHRSYKGAPLPDIGKSPRQLLQTLGTEWGRSMVSPDIWIRMAERRIDALAASGVATVAVADVRFENEAEWIRGRGGQIWHVRRSDVTADGHASENGIAVLDGDVVIDNSGTLDDLRRAVEAALAG